MYNHKLAFTLFKCKRAVVICVFVYTLCLQKQMILCLESVLLSPLIWRVYDHKFALTLFKCKRAVVVCVFVYTVAFTETNDSLSEECSIITTYLESV